VFIRRETLEGLEPAGEVVGGDEVGEVLPELVVAVVVEAFDRRLLDRPVHALDLAVRPRVSRFRQPMLDVEVGAGKLEGVSLEQRVLCPQRLDLFRRPGATLGVGEVGAVVGQDCVDLVRNGGGERSDVAWEI
jgi:hypothetical protein